MVRAIALYLPQFHPIPENDRWWGKGFTEWTNVTRSRPLFPGHYQPHLPADLGFYDLRVAEIRQEQASLAREYGIYGFCYYHYWFGGRRLLERPFNEVLTSGEPDFPFCLCWANENWTRRWDGGDREILMEQVHTDDNHHAFIRELIPAFRDRRYIRVDGRPLLMVYRTEILPDPHHIARIWRDECVKAGVGDPYLVRTESFHACDPRDHGFDATYEFPPHQTPGDAGVPASFAFTGGVTPEEAGFTGGIYRYDELARCALERPRVPYKRFRGVLAGWDNSARSGKRAKIFLGSSPELYRHWLSRAVEQTREIFAGDEQLVFINAWNEWAEGCHLEPDQRYGRQYLEATRLALLESVDTAQAWIREGERALGDPAASRAWIERALVHLERQDATIRAAASELGALDRAQIAAVEDERELKRLGHRVVGELYRAIDRLRGTEKIKKRPPPGANGGVPRGR